MFQRIVNRAMANDKDDLAIRQRAQTLEESAHSQGDTGVAFTAGITLRHVTGRIAQRPPRKLAIIALAQRGGADDGQPAARECDLGRAPRRCRSEQYTASIGTP